MTPPVDMSQAGRPTATPTRRAWRPVLLFAHATSLAVLLAVPSAGSAQLRPLEPLDWSVLDRGWTVGVSLGAAALEGQRASLAGAEGRLYEVGIVEGAWKVGRTAIQATGVARRVLQIDAAYESPVRGVNDPAEGRLRDVGEVRIGTIVPLYMDSLMRSSLRFGTRLPVSDSEVGLGRDVTDFYALLGGQARYHGTTVGVEAGVGIHGTVGGADYEQVDVLLYNAEIGRRFGWLRTTLSLAGQVNGLASHTVRGNEDLQELRLGVRAGRATWLRVDLIRGFRSFSPQHGIRVVVGTRR